MCNLFCHFIVRAQTGGAVYTVAGGGGSSAEGVPATAAAMVCPISMTMDGIGNFYVADRDMSKVRMVDHISGLIYTVAGTSTFGAPLGDGGPATNASVYHPLGVCSDGAGNLYIADNGHGRIRKVDVSTGFISTVAGGGMSMADGVPATSDTISPQCLVLDAANNIYTGSFNKVRRIDAVTGIITTVAGNGSTGDGGDGGPATNATISGVQSLTVDGIGNIYVVSGAENKVRKINAVTGIITTVAGGGTSTADGVSAISELLNSVTACAADNAGNLFISCGVGGTPIYIKKVDAATNLINTIAGGGTTTAEGAPATATAMSVDDIYLDALNKNIYYAGCSTTVRRFSYSLVSTGTHSTNDSFSVNISDQCNGPITTIVTPHYLAGRSIKTYFGDGSTDSTVISPSYSGSGYGTVNHAYGNSGTYTIRHVLYLGSVIQDTVWYTHNYNYCRTLSINLYGDLNSNCIKDGTDPYLSLPTLTEIDSNGISKDTISATSGFSYDAHCSPGDIYSFKIILPPGNLTITCPVTGIISDTLPNTNSRVPVKYFGASCSTGSALDLQVYSTSRAGIHAFESNIIAENSSCYPVAATVTMLLSPKYHFQSASPTPSAVSGNSITWNISSLTYNANAHIHIWGETPGPRYAYGDTVFSSYTIDPITGDAHPADNICIRNDTVHGGFDPNYMDVTPSGYISSGTKLQYTIDFENTGNDTAFNIYVMDTLSDNVDISSMRLLTASAAMFVSKSKDGYGHNILKFDFPDINLLDSSHHNECTGLVMFTINTRPGLPDGTTIFNRGGYILRC